MGHQSTTSRTRASPTLAERFFVLKLLALTEYFKLPALTEYDASLAQWALFHLAQREADRTAGRQPSPSSHFSPPTSNLALGYHLLLHVC